MLTRNRDRLHAFACALSFFLAGMPAAGTARADSMDKAIAAVKGASDEDLRKEVERRLQKSRGTARSVAATRGLTSGAAPSGLASLDDAQLLTAAHAMSRSIYGADDRRDWYQVSSAAGLEPLAHASVALFDASKLDAPAGGTVHINAKSFQEARRLCSTTPPVKFAGQPSGAFCSGTLVRPDTVLTAGHCVREISGNEALPPNVTGVKFVFGYLMQKPDADPTAMPAANVFTGKAVVGGESGDNADARPARLGAGPPRQAGAGIHSRTGLELGNRARNQGSAGLRHGISSRDAAQIRGGRHGSRCLERGVVRCQSRYFRRQLRLRRVRPDDQEADRRSGRRRTRL